MTSHPSATRRFRTKTSELGDLLRRRDHPAPAPSPAHPPAPAPHDPDVPDTPKPRRRLPFLGLKRKSNVVSDEPRPSTSTAASTVPVHSLDARPSIPPHAPLSPLPHFSSSPSPQSTSPTALKPTRSTTPTAHSPTRPAARHSRTPTPPSYRASSSSDRGRPTITVTIQSAADEDVNLYMTPRMVPLPPGKPAPTTALPSPPPEADDASEPPTSPRVAAFATSGQPRDASSSASTSQRQTASAYPPASSVPRRRVTSRGPVASDYTSGSGSEGPGIGLGLRLRKAYANSGVGSGSGSDSGTSVRKGILRSGSTLRSAHSGRSEHRPDKEELTAWSEHAPGIDWGAEELTDGTDIGCKLIQVAVAAQCRILLFA
ncbi:hypothetical protein FA95DRAFT_1602012 [Auriscalpium vulgare]|uniref:Uncharacterized protein n=1 Tax=Auriscalpium vulgare TaxID=40419 RepID=A0ACB8S918_9AGAM|nr:hypothetical protein FA95DRAFT_1602012 [Auriscalpium vulgare]